MRKGNYGFNLWFYPAIAFVLAIFGQTLLCGLVTILAIAAEKDEWTSRQTMQAFFLGLVNSAISVVRTVFSVITWIPLLGGVVSTILNFIAGFLSLIVLLVAVLGVLHVVKGEDAKVPVIAGLMDKIFE